MSNKHLWTHASRYFLLFDFSVANWLGNTLLWANL